MTNPLKRISLLCGIALITLAAFPVFAQNNAEVAINRKPLKDFTDLVIDRLQKNELVLSDNFLVEVEGELDQNGRFDLQKTKYIRAEGNEQILNVAKSAIEAVNDSGVFSYLKYLSAKKINLFFAQNDAQIYAVINFELNSANKIKAVNTVFNAMLMTIKQNSKNEDEKILANSTTVTENDKTVTIKTSVEKSVGQAMIQRQIEKELARRQMTETSK